MNGFLAHCIIATLANNEGGALRHAQAGDVVLIVSEKDRRCFIRTLAPGGVLQTHRGVLKHDELIGLPLGSQVRTHLGFPYYLFTPTTAELVRYIRRESQIIFPKDAGYIIMKLGVKPGSVVVEAGTGSGGLCLVLATLVGDEGRVFSYDLRPKMQQIAQENLRRAGLLHRVTFRLKDVSEGFDETDVDALFLDLLTPWDVIDQAYAALRGSGMLGCLMPTANQLVRIVETLESHPGFGFIEAEEVMLRAYKTLPARVRPQDRMVAHTGYLVFGRAVVLPSYDGKQIQAPASDDTEEGQESLP